MIASSPQPDVLVAWMDGLADPTRLRLLRLLERHELGVGELCEVLQIPQSTVSRHLKVLTDQEWTRRRRRGTTNLYRMTVEDLQDSARKLWRLARDEVANAPTFKQDQLRLGCLIRRRRQHSQVFFAGAAAEWDRHRADLYGWTFNEAALLALLPVEWVVADLGCGTGLLAADLAAYVAKVIGIDSSTVMLKAARRRTKGLSNVELHRGDLEDVPLTDATCNAAILCLVLTYVTDPAVVLAETARILKPGGRIVVVDLIHHQRDEFRRQMEQQCFGFETQEINQLLSKAGFHTVTTRPLLPESAVSGPALLLATGCKAEKESTTVPSCGP